MGEPSSSTSDLTYRDVSSLLAATLGWEKSEEVVLNAARSLGLDPNRLMAEEARAILGMLAGAPGIIGVTARFARSRADFTHRAPPRSSRASDPPSSGPIYKATQSPDEPAKSFRISSYGTDARAGSISIADITALFTPHVGAVKSSETVAAAARMLGIHGDRIAAAEAERLLESLSKQDGMIGVTARVAKARLPLKVK